ncbi:Fibronectin type III domain-containing protein [Roseateles sp. YR242]|uniref:glycoside hydrolase family 9 protein n=1 Tax=Roseateles sp. YR242 TaxID=1855305 RepID=UPI0008C20839|nr:glycoside hydrolase family 9 protein [Roseateles sp. YR242]SEK23160.1 Fibronectin type III domain-containing protein [Roseateles sp. YR242]
MSTLIDRRRLQMRLAAPLLAFSLAACGGGDSARQTASPMSADGGATAKTLAVAAATAAPAYNYAEALQKSILFYEAQQSGKKPEWNRVSWRGDSRLSDGSDVGLDLTGGWYDAGDHVKFGFPAAWTATQLAWGALEFEAGHKDAGQYDALLRNLRWINDYFIKAHPSANVLYGQVGNGSVDHSWWGPVEVYPKEAPAYKIDATCGGSDLAGETAAAMAAASMVFKTSDPSYAATLLTHARQLFTLADTKRQKYVECITDAQGYYNSWSGYVDELAWGAVWLYRATGETAYLDKAESFVTTASGGFGSEGQTGFLPYKWTQDWDSKHYGSYLLLARLTGKQKYKDAIERNLAYWTTGTPEGERVTYTPGGLAWLSQWGSLRYALNESFIALVYAKDVADATKQQRYRDFGMQQLNYALGSNPRNSSYLIGFGVNPPQHPHHRTAHGSWADSQTVPTNHRHVLYGALVGGPGANDGYTDSIADYVSNEVAIDYNASIVGVLAAAQQLFPGSVPLANFPQPEVATEDEYFVEAAINSAGTTYTEVKALVNNRSGWPARVTDKLSLRYYVDLSEVIAAGRSAADIKVSSNYSEGGVARGLVRCGASNLYYAAGDFSGTKVYPGGQSAYKKEIQIRVAAPDSTSFWNPANDPSYAGLGASGTTPVKVTGITLYDETRKIWGNEPAACGGVVVPLPATPAGLTATAGVGSISLSWSASTNATGYTLKRSTTGTAGSFALLASPTGTSYVDSGLAGSTRYYYTVSARNDSGESAASDPVWTSTPAGPPAAPAPTATAGDGKVTLNWPAVTGAASYEVTRATSATGSYAALASGLTALTLTDSGLTNGTTYFYKVGARNTAGVTLSDPVSATPGGGGGSSNCTLTLDTTNDWGSGQVLRLMLSNPGTTPIANWGVAFTESNSFTVSNSWSGTFLVTGNQVSFTPPSWSLTVPAGGSADAGMQLSYSGTKPTPGAVVMTGASCKVVIN